MWAKISSALKSRHAHQEGESTQSSQGDVMTRVLEQHPNLSVFHTHESPSSHPPPPLPPPPPHPASPPSSPSKRAMFKRLSKDPDSVRAPSPSLRLLPKKMKAGLPFNNNNASPPPLPSSTGDSGQPVEGEQPPPPKHKTQPSQETVRSLTSTFRRPSLDLLRMNTQESTRPSLDSPVDNRMNSVRSILRDPNTPGTGQNVRFFSRDAYKVISPEESMEENFLSPPQQVRIPEHTSFLDRLNQLDSNNTNTPIITRTSPPGSKSRPSLNGIFSPLDSSGEMGESDQGGQHSLEGSVSMSLSGLVSPPSFDMSHQLDLPAFPPGLGFDVHSPLLGNGIDLNFSMDDADSAVNQMTSTPCKPTSVVSEKGKEKEDSFKEEEEGEVILVPPVNAPVTVDETIFHAREKPPQFPPALHDRSQSFSFGQTVFYSLAKSPVTSDLSPAFTSSDNVRPSEEGSSNQISPLAKPRSRALSDTVFQTMLRSPPADEPPEEDINDESSHDLIMFTPPVTEPDPFSANANTYYTPQTMIPTTPPQGLSKQQGRRTSKEEGLIYSLQTQLALQAELCSQYEADLRARDELVEILGRKVSDLEKQESQRRNALRQWKKKVQELERACRLLEEEVDSSRQESAERSVMDEASGEALRMLHRQIASLEREKQEWVGRENSFKEEVETLEVLIKERTEDVVNLKEVLWTRDESERELKDGLREAKEQIEMLGNVSLGLIDEEEMRRLGAERSLRFEEERQQSRVAEIGWKQEHEELMMKLELIQVEKAKVEEQLDSLKQQMKAKEEEFSVLKSELDAQWGHSEKATERIQDLQAAKLAAEDMVVKLERENTEITQERDDLAKKCGEVEQRVGDLELEWNESENKKTELESELQELWELKDNLEKECEQFEEQLEQERGHSEGLSRALQQCEDRIAQLEQERQFATENIDRLEGNLRRKDEEIGDYSKNAREQDSEAERLREEIGKLRREHSHTVGEQSRALKEAVESEDEARKQLQTLVREKAEGDVELRTFRDRVNTLTADVGRLHKQVYDLQQESADKEVKIVQYTKQHAQDKEDIQGLNIALDAKQQELELFKRKMAIKSNSVGTPASAAKTSHRRDPSVFDNTPTLSRAPSRAGSVVSDSGSVKNSGETSISALGKSSRINIANGGITGSTVKRRVEGSMGPPPLKPRPSVTGTPTPAGRASTLARSGTAKPQNGGPTTPIAHRRVVSGGMDKARARPSVMSPEPSVSELDEKENIDTTPSDVRRRSLIPTPV